MKKKIKDLWVEALRSGKYRQGKGYLNNNGRYCCLGVLCELALKAGVLKEKFRMMGRTYYYRTGEVSGKEGAAILVPSKVMEWAGLKSASGSVSGKSLVKRDNNVKFYGLDALNDDGGAKFDEIADVIEKNWRRL